MTPDRQPALSLYISGRLHWHTSAPATALQRCVPLITGNSHGQTYDEPVTQAQLTKMPC